MVLKLASASDQDGHPTAVVHTRSRLKQRRLSVSGRTLDQQNPSARRVIAPRTPRLYLLELAPTLGQTIRNPVSRRPEPLCSREVRVRFLMTRARRPRRSTVDETGVQPQHGRAGPGGEIQGWLIEGARTTQAFYGWRELCEAVRVRAPAGALT